MTNGNGNGETKKLVELRHSYKAEVSQLEEDLKAKFQEQLEAGRKDLKDKYLEKVVDWFYANGFNEPPREPAVEVTPPPTPAAEGTVTPPTQPEPDEEELPEQGPALSTPVCEGCGSTLEPDAKFCSQCAAPVETQAETNPPAQSVATAGRMISRPRSLSQLPPTERERMIKAARQMAAAPGPDRRAKQRR